MSEKMTKDNDGKESSRREVIQIGGALGGLLLFGSTGSVAATNSQTTPSDTSDNLESYQPPAPARVITSLGSETGSKGIFGSANTISVGSGETVSVQTTSRPPVQTFQTWVKPDSNFPVAKFDYLSPQGNRPGYQVELDTGAGAVNIIEVGQKESTTKSSNTDLNGSFTADAWHRVNVGIDKGTTVVRVYDADEEVLAESNIDTEAVPGQLANTDAEFAASGGIAQFTEVVSDSIDVQLDRLTKEHGDIVSQQQSANRSDSEGVRATMEFSFEFNDGVSRAFQTELLTDGTLAGEFSGDEYLGVITERQREQTAAKLEQIQADLQDGGEI